MRIGIFGGTFDPVHQAHLIVAEQCREQGQLDQVWFVPSARPPHKLGRPLASFAQRKEMLELAVAGNPAFRIDDLEENRPGPSYTVDTVEYLHRRQPDVEFHLVLGSDCLPELPQWRQPTRILQLAGLLIVTRPGWPVRSAEQVAQAIGLSEQTFRQQLIEGPVIDISSRELRRRVADGRSIRYLVPRAVECYIAAHRLYSDSQTP